MTINPVFTDATPLSAVSSEEQFRDDVLVGLTAAQKFIPAKYFYDEVGSDLFEAITRQPEYYPTRTEIGILDESGRTSPHFFRRARTSWNSVAARR